MKAFKHAGSTMRPLVHARALARCTSWQKYAWRRYLCSRPDVKPSQEEQAGKEEGPRTFGEKFVVFGLALRGLALVPRLAPAAQALRFAGVGPMAIGAVVSLYELGGWRLMLAIPGAAGLAVSASWMPRADVLG